MNNLTKWVFAGSLTCAALASTADVRAALLVDVRVAGGGKSATVTDANRTVNLEIYGVVTGSDATSNEGLQSAYGTLFSGTGGLLGNMSIVTPAGNFTANVDPTGRGAALDIGGDGDTDRGAVDGGTTTDYVYIRAASMQTNGTPGIFSGVAGNEYLLGTATFTATTLDTAGTTLNWRPRLSAAAASVATAALWQQDGTGTANPSNAAYDAATSPYRAGSPVTISTTVVPEPASFGLLGVAAAGLLARRRRRA